MGTSAVFALWVGLDFFFHGVVLGDYYEETASLWRPVAEANMVLNTVVVLLCSLAFTLIYLILVNPKGIRVALLYGTLFGAAVGAATGYGAYAFMPVPHVMGFVWTLTGFVEGIAGGAALGWLIKDSVKDSMADEV